MGEKVVIVGGFDPAMVERVKQHHDVLHVPSRDAFDSLDDTDLAGVEAFASFGWGPADVIDRMPDLKLLSSFGVGYDGVAAQHAADKGIIVTHTPDVLNDEVANTAIILLLTTIRKFIAYDRYVRDGKWPEGGEPPLTMSVAGKTVGILGLGRIGETIAEKLGVFGCTVVYHSRNEKPGVPYRYYGDLVGMARDCDAIIIVTPGGPATKHLVNRDVIDALGSNGTLVNIARGTVVDETALVAALQDGRLGFAGLDVFEHEPQVPEVLFDMENVVLTPHIGSATVETRRAMGDLVADNILDWFAKGRARTPVPECAHLNGA